MTKQIQWPLAALAVALFLGPQLPFASAADEVVSVGAGGYLTAPPKDCKPLPDKIYKTSDFKGAMPTNQWWSSLVWNKYSQPMFAHPLSMTCAAEGLQLHYAGAEIHGNAGGISGTGGGKEGDLKIGHSAAASFPQADCAGYSDWFVTADFTSGSSSLRTAYGHGSPFVYCTYAGGDPTVTFSKEPKIWSGSATSPVLGVTVNGHHYGVFGASGSTWTGVEGTKWTNNANGKTYFSVALLPDNKPETLALFQKYAYSHVTDTKLDYKVDGGFIKATYQFTINPKEGSEQGTLFALYPHQWKYATSKLTGLTYGSVRGEMKLGEGTNFTTEVPVQGLLPMLPAQGIQNKDRMVGYLNEATKKNQGFGDTYFEGKHLGLLATMSGIAEMMNETSMQETYITELKRRLENWFTATPGKSSPVFYYNSNWGTLVGSKPSFGSDKPLNDHHFHYGYFIRAAAEVARLDPEWAKKWGPMVEILIRDVASPDRQDPLFPYVRCFDKYAGHSWASGDANFVDGNNQESSSESMNAWYGLTMWGQATNNPALRDLGLMLFNTERTAVEEYWFDMSGTNFPKDFPNVALGMVWGAKGAFGTWFSGDIDCIHGINWLPFTPASIYMGRHPDYVKKNHDRIVEKRKGGKDYNNGWGDLVIMFNALNDPEAAASYIDATPNCKIEGGNSHAFMYHWIYTLNNLGKNDSGLTANYSFQNVYRKNGKNTYAVYNYSDQPLSVTFSDGKVISAPGKGMTVQSAN